MLKVNNRLYSQRDDSNIVLRMDNIASRILLDDSSAESLLGKGDLLYKCIGDPVRLQSPYLPGEELKRVFATKEP